MKAKTEAIKPCPDFALAELVKALEGQNINDREGYFTTQELCKQVGHGVNWVRSHLGIIDRAGGLMVVRRPSLTLDKRHITKPAYRLKPPEDGPIK